MPSVSLQDRSLIRVAGADAQGFLHNLITTDVNGLPEGEARPGALLTPQGKILFDFMLWRDGEGFVLECETSIADALLKRLTMYKLRAAVTLTAEAQGVTLVWGEEAGAAQGIVDAAFGKANIRVIRQTGATGTGSQQAYDLLRIEAGLAAAPQDYALQDAFPHDVLMDLNGGLSFRKGCYVGQEVVSRMQHRGTARRRVVQVSAEHPLPEAGTEIVAGGKPIGQLGTIVGNRALAIVRTDRAGDAMSHDVAILAGEVPVTLTLPAWTSLSFPAAADGADA